MTEAIWNETAVPGTLTEAEVADLHDHVDKTPAPSDAELKSYGQLRMAYWLARVHGDRLLYAHDLRQWHVWDGTRWAPDTKHAAGQYAIDCLHDALDASMTDPDLRQTVRMCQTANAVEGILRLAESMPEFAVTSEDLDQDPYLVNVANGTVDLHTMELRPHDPADRLTKVTRGEWHPERVGTVETRWDTFLAQVLPDEDVRRYFQAFVGLSLCGAAREQIFTIATGKGANGKGVAYNAILHALADYGHAAESTLFMQSRGNANSASPAMFALMGKRFVVVSETERDQPLATALMKSLTGGDPITARALHRMPVTFAPTFTPLMVTNYLPKIDGTDPAAWRRIRVIPFDVVVPEAERDPELGAKLEAQEEADAVLGWALDGWTDYAANGMPKAEAVMQATDAYRRESDTVARFIADRCVVQSAARATLTDLYAEYEVWSREDGADALHKRQFSEQVEGLGFEKRRGSAGMQFRGLGIAVEETA